MISRIVQFEFRREIISSLLSKHDRWTPITPRIPVFAHPPGSRTNFTTFPSLPRSPPSVTSAAFYRTLLKTGCRLLCSPVRKQTSYPPPPSLLTPMIDHFDLIIGYTTIASKSRKRRNRRG